METTKAQFAEIGARLLADEGQADANRLVEVAARAMRQAAHAGVTVVRADRRPRTLAATDDLPAKVDALQYTAGEGPCLDAIAGDDLVVSDDLTSEARWPGFATRCAETLGVRSMLSVRLALSHEDRAALNFYARQPAAFDDLDIATSTVLAPFAGLIVQQEVNDTDVANLRQALETSRQIGTAVGILMARYRVDNDAAFQMLRSASMNLNRKLRDVASDVEHIGDLPA